MPAPSISNDGSKVKILWRPAQYFTGYFCVGHQSWRVPCPSRRIPGNDFTPGNTPCRIDYLAHRRAVTSSEVDGNSVAVVEQMLERHHMGAREIFHMNIVAHGCAIRRRIICSKHRDIGFPTRGRIKDHRNEMRLWIVILADLSRWVSTSRVETTQPCRFHSMGAAKIIHHALANELAEPIGIDRIGHRMLGD